MLAVCKVSNS